MITVEIFYKVQISSFLKNHISGRRAETWAKSRRRMSGAAWWLTKWRKLCRTIWPISSGGRSNVDQLELYCSCAEECSYDQSEKYYVFMGPCPLVNIYPPAGSDNGPGRTGSWEGWGTGCPSSVGTGTVSSSWRRVIIIKLWQTPPQQSMASPCSEYIKKREKKRLWSLIFTAPVLPFYCACTQDRRRKVRLDKKPVYGRFLWSCYTSARCLPGLGVEHQQWSVHPGM